MVDHLEVECTGLETGNPPEPSLMVIFGAGGDLTRRELIPSLFQLFAEDLLPHQFAVIGFSRGDWSDDEFRRRMLEAFEPKPDPVTWQHFAERLHFCPGDFDDLAAFQRLKQRVEELAKAHEIPDNVFFHLACPPSFFPVIVDRLDAVDLEQGKGWRRLVVEKPFGTDRASARDLDQRLRRVFPEESIYRIDHFLGKETVQNMLVFRFANPSFEPIWNRNYIDHVQITVAEDIGIGTRAGFYETVGVVRDMVQNHLLQLLCMTAIEPPVRFDGAALRDETVKVLRSFCAMDVEKEAVRGQYGPGTVGGAAVPGYREEANVDPRSATPTFVALKFVLDNWRWAGVPFYLRTGKRMAKKLTEVAIQFKPTPHLMFPVDRKKLHQNQLTFRLQPQEGIIQTFAAKRPGPELSMCPVRMNFLYADTFSLKSAPRAYAWLLRDVMQGDQTLFARSDWIDAAWGIIDPIVQYWESKPPADVPNYAAGTWGPAAADRLIGEQGRHWDEI